MGNFNRGDDAGGRGNYGKKSYSGGSSEREMFKAVCASCGKECEVPFKPTGSKPVYCRDCFQKNSPQASGGGRNQSGERRGGFNDRPMFNAVCDKCGENCQLPFEPRAGKEVLCSKCFEEKGGNPRKNGGQANFQLDAVNAKLDKILELLSPTPKTPKKEKAVEIVKEVKPEAISPEIELSSEIELTPESAVAVNEEVKTEKTPRVKKITAE